MNLGRKNDEEYLSSMKAYQEEHASQSDEEEKRKPRLNKKQSARLMSFGIFSFILMLFVDMGYRQFRFTDSPWRIVFYILFLICAVGVIQFPSGLYYYIKNIFSDVPMNKMGR